MRKLCYTRLRKGAAHMTADYRAQRRGLILNMICRFGPVSRTRLTALTGYRAASVGEITKELLTERLIVERGSSSVGHGRRRELLDINKAHLCALGIGFSAGCASLIAAQIDGVILRRVELPIAPGASRAELAGAILHEAVKLLEALEGREVIGIGLCNPLFDPTAYRGNSILTSYLHFNDWIDLQLRPQLEAQTQLPVSIFSAVTLPALAERRFGAARGVDNFLCIELSNGLGSSICCSGHVVAGAGGVAGELGHTVVDASDRGAPLCYCGKAGCVERTSAFPALAADILAALDSGVSSSLSAFYDRAQPLRVQDIRRALAEGDQMCTYYVRRAAGRLGIAIANAVNLLNPELVVLFGFMTGLGDVFLRQLETSIRENVLALSGGFRLRVSDTLERDLPLGAVAELFSAYLRVADYSWVYDLPDSGADGESKEPESDQMAGSE